MTHAAAPALDTDDAVTTRENSQLDSLTDAPLETLINIFLPVGGTEVGLWLWEAERIHAAVQMRVPRCSLVAGDHDDGTDWTVLGEDASRGAARFWLAWYGCRKVFTYLVVRTKIAPAFNSILEPTAEIAIDSMVEIGLGQACLSSSKALA